MTPRLSWLSWLAGGTLTTEIVGPQRFVMVVRVVMVPRAGSLRAGEKEGSSPGGGPLPPAASSIHFNPDNHDNHDKALSPSGFPLSGFVAFVRANPDSARGWSGMSGGER